jgi:CDP-glucose 4,6-dehydratase
VKILITGHTGFKGSWLTILLKELGHDVSGYALAPESESLFNFAEVSKMLTRDTYADIRDRSKLFEFVRETKPEVVFHLAAQPLVRHSYFEPTDTFSVNVDGTLNLLNSCEASDDTKVVVVITTDKVYRNDENKRAFVESDPLGGIDPYSTSKAMADLLTQSWSRSVSKKTIMIARAGNVIGGGDFSRDRLIPDLYRSIVSKSPAQIRNPLSVRPWQHVLDCINGYIHLMDKALTGLPADSWNFGPDDSQYKKVEDLTDAFLKHFGNDLRVEQQEAGPYEAEFLSLDSSKAREYLGWGNAISFEQSIILTAGWYKSLLLGRNMQEYTVTQVREFLAEKEGR